LTSEIRNLESIDFSEIKRMNFKDYFIGKTLYMILHNGVKYIIRIPEIVSGLSSQKENLKETIRFSVHAN